MSGKSSDWFPLSANYYTDDKIMEAGVPAEILYVRACAWCAGSMTDGRFTRRQAALFGVGLGHVAARLRPLLRNGLVIELVPNELYQIAAWAKYNKPAADILAARERSKARQQAWRNTKGTRNVTRNTTRDERVKNNNVMLPETETETGSNRTPSGSVRLEPAAEPRSASGAARPQKIVAADEVGCDEDVEPLDVDPREYARQQIAKGRAKNPAAGKPFPGFWRQPTRVGKPEPAPTMFADAMSKLDSMLSSGNGIE